MRGEEHRRARREKGRSRKAAHLCFLTSRNVHIGNAAFCRLVQEVVVGLVDETGDGVDSLEVSHWLGFRHIRNGSLRAAAERGGECRGFLLAPSTDQYLCFRVMLRSSRAARAPTTPYPPASNIRLVIIFPPGPFRCMPDIGRMTNFVNTRPRG